MTRIAKNLFTDYKEFVDKFKPKKTTDDCYTPEQIYNIVKDFAIKWGNLSNSIEVVRPFYPGCNYLEYDYPDNCVVIDNPPFSIISQIAKDFEKNNIKYFLFAPHMTLFSVRASKNLLPCGVQITYENGAIIPTSFISNLGENKIETMCNLYEQISKIQTKEKANLPKYRYPKNVLMISDLINLIKTGTDFSIKNNECVCISALDAQKTVGKTCFGQGYLISDSKADQLKADQLKAEKEVIIWNLSEREKSIIKLLN